MSVPKHEPQRLLRAILDVMGAGTLTSALALGCGGNVVVDSSGAAGLGGGGGSTSSTSSTSSATTTNSTTVTTGPTICAYDPPTYGTAQQACLPLDGDVCPIDSPYTLDLLADVLGVCSELNADCCTQPVASEILCSSLPGDSCCYVVLVDDSGICVGRPFTVAGEARRAPVVRAARAIDAASRGAIDAITRRAIADGWLRDAQLEHASVASFARLALELCAVGAPADLVREAQEAMGDEIRHAELSFAIAGAYAGAEVRPGALPIEGATLRASIAELAAATVREGCVGETIAAILAAEARDLAVEPAARDALTAIAGDEARHAASAWKLVAWAARAGGSEAREAIARAFDAAFAEGVAVGSDAPGVDHGVMRAHGRLPAGNVARAADRAMAEVIAPARAALLALDPAIEPS